MIDLAAIGVREIVLGTVVLISLYLAVTVLRLFFVGMPQDAKAPAPFPEPESDALAGNEAAPDVAAKAPSALEEAASRDVGPARWAALRRWFRRQPGDTGQVAERREPDLEDTGRENQAESGDDRDESAPVTADVIDFSRELARSNLTGDVQRLQREMAVLRQQLGELRDEVAQLKAARNVSPLYNEAMTMAQRGMAAVSIADRCGISMGEAELVAALAKDATASDAPRQHTTNEDSDDFYSERGYRRHG